MTTQLAAELRLMQLCSPSLPIGAFAYSHGLESLISTGQISNEADASRYLSSYTPRSLGYLELPRLLRMHQAFEIGNLKVAHEQSQLLFAARETKEFRNQETQLAHSFHRLLRSLAPTWPLDSISPLTFSELFAFATVQWQIGAMSAIAGFGYLYVDGLVTAIAKLLALGPSASQHLLSDLIVQIPSICETAMNIKEDDVGATSPGLALVSARHETQHFRLFRS